MTGSNVSVYMEHNGLMVYKMRALVTFIALSATAGCGMVPVASERGAVVQAKVVTAASNQGNVSRVEEGQTGVGNRFKAHVFKYSEQDSTVRMRVTYDDRRNYFGAIKINAFAEVMMSGGRRQRFTNIELNQPSGGLPIRNGEVILDGIQNVGDVRSVELAFFNYGQWDSNHGKNYTLKF